MHPFRKAFIGLGLVLATCSALGSKAAQAQLLQGAVTHSKGDGSVGGYASLYFYPGVSFVGMGQVTYGFLDRLQGELRLGGGSFGGLIDFYLGAYAKFYILHTKIVSLGVWGGLTRLSFFAFDVALPLSHSFGSWELYLSPLLRIPFVAGAPVGLSINPGGNFTVAKGLKVYLEAQLAAVSMPWGFTGGVRYYF